MSQNRQEAKDRLRARNDYQVNLKAELEIRHLHAWITLLSHQWERMIDIQGSPAGSASTNCHPRLFTEDTMNLAGRMKEGTSST